LLITAGPGGVMPVAAILAAAADSILATTHASGKTGSFQLTLSRR